MLKLADSLDSNYSQSGETSTRAYRADVDGLRAAAVLAVLLFHLGFESFSGGYVGVDVFFVISGYLITKNIVDDLAAHRFTLAGFFVRRVRRLYPALLATILVCFALGAVVLSPIHFERFAVSCVSAAMSVSNIWFWAKAGYFDTAAEFKPLLHTWSLGVEFQFYLLWPLVILALFAALNPIRIVIIPLVLVLGILLVITQIFLSPHPTTFFYLTPFRMIEFAVGALCVWVPMWLRIRPRWQDEFLYLSGGSLVLASCLIFTGSTPFPGLTALVPCAGTALMILTGRDTYAGSIARSAIASFLGRISYSLYLVHWPIIVFYSYFKYEPLDLFDKTLLVVSTFAAALPLYFLVEKPFRRGAVLISDPGARRFLAACAISGVLLAIPVGHIWATSGWSWRVQSQRPANSEITSALDGRVCQDGVGFCNNGHEASQILMVGDSHAGHFKYAIAKLLIDIGVKGQLDVPQGNCPALFGAVRVKLNNLPLKENCDAIQRRWDKHVKSSSADIVILASFWAGGIRPTHDRLARLNSDQVPTLDESRQIFVDFAKRTVRTALAAGKGVVIMGMGPIVNKSPIPCFERPLRPSGCELEIKLEEEETHQFLRKVFTSIAANNSSVFYFDTMAAFCPGGQCTFGEGWQSFLLDKHHLTRYGAMWLKHHHFVQLKRFIVDHTANGRLRAAAANHR